MFRQLVDEEKEKAREQHGQFASMHEILGVLTEEFYEFMEEVRKKPQDRKPEDTLAELVQISAIAEMAAEDMELVDIGNEYVASSKYIELKNAVIDLINSIVSGQMITTKHRGGKVFVLNEDHLDRVKELVND